MKKVKRPSKLNTITAAIIQENTHDSSSDVIRRRRVLDCKREALDAEIIELSSRISSARLQRNRVDAALLGLGIVIERRERPC